MVKRRIQLKDISNVAAGRTVVIDCPVGPRYHSVTLVLGNSAAGDANAPTVSAIVGEIRCLLGGAIQRRVTGARLDVINTAMGATYASQGYTGSGNGLGRRHLTLYFGEPWRKRMADQDALAWQTGWLDKSQTFQIEVEMVSGITPVLSAFAVVDNFNSGKPHGIMKWFTNDFAAVGSTVEIAKLERRDLYSQLSIFDTSDSKSVAHARLVVGGVEVHDLSANENTTLLKNNDMNPASGCYHLVFDHDDALDDVLPANVNDMQLTLTMSAAANGTLSIVSQRLGLPE